MDADLSITVVLAVGTLVLLALLATSLPLAPPTPPGEGAEHPDESTDRPQFGGTIGGPRMLTSILKFLFLGLLGLLIGGIAIAVHRLHTSPPPNTHDPEQHSSGKSDVSQADGTLNDVAETADRTATRIRRTSSTDIENDVLRAWDEMTRALTVSNRQSTTPREFVGIAIHAGMREDDVRALTHLFEQVRYGGLDPSQEDEEQAVALLEHIAAEYGAEDA